MNTWPDGAMTPFRNEKNTNWEGAFRVPMLVRWPGKIKAGHGLERASCSTTTGCRRSWRWPASPTSSRSCKKGYKVGDKNFKVHIDGYNLLPYLTGEAKKSPRKGFIYFSDDGELRRLAVRQLEDGVHGAAHRGTLARVGGAVREAARAEAVQPAHRPVTSGRTSRRTPITTGA